MNTTTEVATGKRGTYLRHSRPINPTGKMQQVFDVLKTVYPKALTPQQIAVILKVQKIRADATAANAGAILSLLYRANSIRREKDGRNLTFQYIPGKKPRYRITSGAHKRMPARRRPNGETTAFASSDLNGMTDDVQKAMQTIISYAATLEARLEKINKAHEKAST